MQQFYIGIYRGRGKSFKIFIGDSMLKKFPKMKKKFALLYRDIFVFD